MLCAWISAATANLAPFGCFLDWGTCNIAIGTIDAAIAFQRTKNRRAMHAVIEKLAGIGWHCVSGTSAALRASKGRSELHLKPVQ